MFVSIIIVTTGIYACYFYNLKVQIDIIKYTFVIFTEKRT